MAIPLVPAPLKSLLLVLSTAAAYLTFSDKTFDGRPSPPIVVSIALLSAIASFLPSFSVCIAMSALTIFAPIFYGLDYIHGDCGYEALTRWDQRWKGWRRHSQLEWYRECIQASQGFYVFILLASLWLFLLAWHAITAVRKGGRIRIKGGEDGLSSPDAVQMSA